MRKDLSDYLIHFTKGAMPSDWEGAYSNLCAILEQSRIKASNSNIKGAFNCVCFTEAPIDQLKYGLLSDRGFSQAAPFGLMFDKLTIFNNGGRSVIYQPEDEYDLLQDCKKWLHVRYEPPKIDWSWQREWRVNRDVQFQPDDISIVFPNHDWIERFVSEYEWAQDLMVNEYAQIMEHELAQQYREPLLWQIINLQVVEGTHN